MSVSRGREAGAPSDIANNCGNCSSDGGTRDRRCSDDTDIGICRDTDKYMTMGTRYCDGRRLLASDVGMCLTLADTRVTRAFRFAGTRAVPRAFPPGSWTAMFAGDSR